jgi:hypothetical protein
VTLPASWVASTKPEAASSAGKAGSLDKGPADVAGQAT